MPQRPLQRARRDDGELLEAVARGDPEAFEELYRGYYSRLFAYLLRILREPELVEETLDDVMLAVWTGARRFRGQSAVSTWIFGIAYRRALKSLRQRRRHSPLDHRSLERRGHGGDLERAEPVAEESPLRDLGRRQFRERLGAALARLSAEQRTVVALSFETGMSYAEIAEVMCCPVNTVKTRMFHARRRLRELMPDLVQLSSLFEEAK